MIATTVDLVNILTSASLTASVSHSGSGVLVLCAVLLHELGNRPRGRQRGSEVRTLRASGEAADLQDALQDQRANSSSLSSPERLDSCSLGV